MKLKLGGVTSQNDSKLVAYSDADYAKDKKDRKSNTGFLIKLHGATVAWGCRKQTGVATLTTNAEYVALSETCKEVVWIRKLLADFNERQKEPTKIYEDNQSCLKLLDHPTASNRTKYIDTKYHYARDLEKREKRVRFEYCPSEKMLADMLTKPLGGIRLKVLREAAGLKDWTIQC